MQLCELTLGYSPMVANKNAGRISLLIYSAALDILRAECERTNGNANATWRRCTAATLFWAQHPKNDIRQRNVEFYISVCNNVPS